MSDIFLESQSGMKCTEIAQATAARLFKKDYQLMFSDCWNFMFFEDEEIIQKGIEQKYFDVRAYDFKDTMGVRLFCNPIKIDQNLEKFHGIETKQFYEVLENDSIDILLNALSIGKFVGMWYDQFYMPWATETRKKAPLRYDGFLMILEYDVDADEFLCVDIHGSRKKELLPMHILREFLCSKEKHRLMTYELCERETCMFDFEENIKRVTKRFHYKKGYNMFENMRNFAYFIGETFDLEKEEQYSLLETEQLSAPTHIEGVKRLRDISRMRNLYSITLGYISQENGRAHLFHLAEQFKVLAGDWQVIVSIIVKASYLKNYTGLGNEVKKRVLSCADNEEMMMDKLINSLYYDYKKNMRVQRKESVGNFMILPKNKKIQAKEYVIAFEAGKYDNVSCNRQIISLCQRVYKEMIIVGMCDSGAYYNQIEVFYEDGIKENKLMGFGEWRFPKCELGEKVIWSGSRVKFGDRSEEVRGYIFEQHITHFREIPIDKLVLPNNNCMHIFKILLLR